MKRLPAHLNNAVLLLLSIVLATASFLLFRLLLSGKTSSYTSEIAAAILGSLLTIIITAIMLNKQSDVDMRKDRSSKMLEKKIEFYDSLMNQLGVILCKGSISKEDVVAVQILNQRMAFIASEGVVESFGKFANLFADAAKDGTFNDKEKDELLKKVGMMSIQMRIDILSREEKEHFNENAFAQKITKNTESLETKKITENGFYGLCTENEKPYFRSLVSFLEENNVAFEMGTKGFSIKNKEGKSIIHCYPSASKKSIEILQENLSEDNRDIMVTYLQGKGFSDAKFQSPHVTFKSTDLPVESLRELVGKIVLGTE